MPGPAGAREGLAVSPGSQSCPRANPPSGVTQWGSSPLQERAGPEALESRYSEWATSPLAPVPGGRFLHGPPYCPSHQVSKTT